LDGGSIPYYLALFGKDKQSFCFYRETGQSSKAACQSVMLDVACGRPFPQLASYGPHK
jgi:hypothetical protein